MAETPVLGSIAVAQEAAAITDPGSVGHKDTLANVASVGAGVADLAKSRLTEGLREDFSEATDAALAGARPSVAGEEEAFPTGTQDEILVARIAKLKAGIAQNTGSAKAALELELRREASKLGDKFPGLRDEIAQSQANFVRTDPEFAALDLADAHSATFAAQQAKDLQLIKDTAYTELGMIPGRVEFGSPEFAREYNYLANLNQATNTNTTVNEALNAEETMSARGRLDRVQQAVTGAASDMSGNIRTMRNQVRDVANAALDITSPGSAATLAAWENGGQDEALSQVANSVFALEGIMNEFPLSEAHTPAFAQARALVDQQIGSLNKLSQALLTGDFNTVKAWETYEVTREIQFQTDNPVLADVGRIMEDNAVLFETMAKDFGAQGDILFNDIAGLINQSLPHVIGRAQGLGGLEYAAPTESVEQILDRQRAIRSQNPYPYGNGQNTPEGIQTNATVQHQQSLSPAVLAQAASNDGAGFAPNAAADILAGSASVTEHMLMAGQFPADAAAPHLLPFANDDMIDLIRLGQKSSQPKAVVAAGQMAASVQFKGDKARFATYNALRDTNLNGVPAKQVIVVDPAELAKGKIVFRADPDRVEKLISPSAQRTSFGALGIGGSLLPQQTSFQRAQEVAAALTQIANEGLAIEAAVTMMKTESPDPDYEAAWVTSGLQEHFGVVPEVRRDLPEITLEPVDPVTTTGNSAASRIRRGQR